MCICGGEKILCKPQPPPVSATCPLVCIDWSTPAATGDGGAPSDADADAGSAPDADAADTVF